MLNFATLYAEKIKPALITEFSYKNAMQAPYIEKVVINVGAGEAVQDSKVMDAILSDIMQITGQRPVFKKAKKSIAAFKLREGMVIGCMVTLRRKKMYSFLERLVYSALPRSREFKGFSSKSFDGRGNFSFGLKEQIIFPEINYDKIDKVRGMDITIVTSANTDQEGKALLKGFDFPFFN